MSFRELENLEVARENSYYTIVVGPEDLEVWINGYEEQLAAAGIGVPKEWFRTTGATVNAFAEKVKGRTIRNRDKFPEDVEILLFPLNDLNIGKLAIFKIQWQDRWFDDVIANMHPYYLGVG